jgi:RNA polymerase sigma-70 factor (family 1)
LTAFEAHSDEELLAAIRNNDAQAFSEFVRRYWKKAYQITYSKVRSQTVTEEIVQDLFTMLWDKRSTLSITHVYAFIFTCIRNKSINYIESQLVRKKYWYYYKMFVPQQEESTTRTVEFNELMEAVETCVETLPEKSRSVFRLSRLEGVPNREIAERLNLSEKSIEYHLTKSLKIMRLALRDFTLVILTAIYL